MNQSLKQNTLAPSLLNMHQRSPLQPAVRFALNGVWKEWTWSQYQNEIFKAASGLLEAQVKPGEKVAICSATRVEWAILDLAVISLQGVSVPIYPNNTPDEIEYVLNHSEVSILFLETQQHFRIWKKLEAKCPKVRRVIVIDSEPLTEARGQSWRQFQEQGATQLEYNFPKIRKSLESIEAEKTRDLVSLIYTSGTTGVPKAAMLSHEQIMSEITEAFLMCGACPDDTSLTFLPFAHILGRIEIWAHVWIGYTMGYAESLERIRHNLLEIRPTFMMAVPRIFEKIYTSIWAQLEGDLVRRKLFAWALDIGKKVSDKKIHRQNLSLPLVLEYELAKKLVFVKIVNAFGGRLRFSVSGGAPLNQEISLFFHAAGILILEGYGLTETTAAICVNTPFNYRFGSVGRPIGDVQLKIASDGEVLVKSQKVMLGYYKDEVATREAFLGDPQDGWLKTGDIGEILETGDLRLTDRKKDLIKTAGGKYIAPQKIEGLLKLNPLIGHALIHGDQKKFVVALLALDKAYLFKLAKEKSWPFSEWTDLINQSEVTDLARRAVAETNSKLASYESIKKFTILPQEFTVEGGELTQSLKIKRRLLDKKFKKQIDSLYV
ncbi:MAG: long-chain fatty acid--CoA ligase [Bdellovibrionales bacterium]|nr:long-chain fatty acid--CoA ligase [Bdellovibrionales bacterium]